MCHSDHSTNVIRVGTAGWSIPRANADRFPGEGTHLERYSRVLNCTEINTSFARSHKFEVYKKWAEQTPADFRFAVKLPREISHDLRLRATKLPLQKFVGEIAGLGDRMGVLLVQLPPSLRFETRPVRSFFKLLAQLFPGAVACEPRHVSWASASAHAVLQEFGVARVDADPAPIELRAVAAGSAGLDSSSDSAFGYRRWHGSPRTYYSSYDSAWLDSRAKEVRQAPPGSDRWCIFDNTASGAAIPNALEFASMLGARHSTLAASR